MGIKQVIIPIEIYVLVAVEVMFLWLWLSFDMIWLVSKGELLWTGTDEKVSQVLVAKQGGSARLSLHKNGQMGALTAVVKVFSFRLRIFFPGEVLLP